MIVIVIANGNFQGKAFCKPLHEENVYILEAIMVRDIGHSYMIIPKLEDQKQRWTWPKNDVSYIGIFT